MISNSNLTDRLSRHFKRWSFHMTQIEEKCQCQYWKGRNMDLWTKKIDLPLKLKKVLEDVDRTERELKENDESKSGRWLMRMLSLQEVVWAPSGTGRSFWGERIKRSMKMWPRLKIEVSELAESSCLEVDLNLKLNKIEVICIQLEVKDA